MLQRSPRSRYAIIFGCLAAALALFIALDSLLSLRAMANSHGARKTYVEITESVSAGETLSSVKYTEMFSGDAPSNAITRNNFTTALFARLDLAKGTILTKEMASVRATQTLDEDSRIVFIPTEEQMSSDISDTTDLIAVSPEGFGSDVIATNARILFDISPSQDSDNSSSHSGYFVRVTSDEALQIAEALASGEVRFALSPQTD